MTFSTGPHALGPGTNLLLTFLPTLQICRERPGELVRLRNSGFAQKLLCILAFLITIEKSQSRDYPQWFKWVDY
jgi:hypothetical protein